MIFSGEYQRAKVAPAVTQTTACIITCHNYAHWLAECLQSCLRQSAPFTCIIVVDDAGSDDCRAVVAGFPGVQYLRTEFGDVAQARNAGAAALPRTDFLLFVDADNVLPVNYHAVLWAGFTENNLAVVYCPLHSYVDGRDLGDNRSIKPFDLDRLRMRNIADTCSLIRYEPFEQLRGWWGERSGLEDWSLWLRITHAGWRMKMVADTHLLYRVHSDQMSRNTPDRSRHTVRTIETGIPLALVTPFGGRKLGTYFQWLKNLDWDKSMLHLVAIDNACDEQYSLRLQAALAASGLSYSYTRIDERALPETSASDLSNTAVLRTRHHLHLHVHMSRIYSLAQGMVPQRCGLVWVVEDDVEPPSHALRDLVTALAHNLQLGSVAAEVPNRFTPGIIAWSGRDMTAKRRMLNAADGRPVLCTTFGCTLFRRQVWDGVAIRPCWNWGTKEVAFDWSAGEDIRRAGWSLDVLPIACRHEG